MNPYKDMLEISPYLRKSATSSVHPCSLQGAWQRVSDVGAAPLLFECRPGQFAAVALRLLDAGPRGAVSWEELEAVVGGEDGAACIKAMVRAN